MKISVPGKHTDVKVDVGSTSAKSHIDVGCDQIWNRRRRRTPTSTRVGCDDHRYIVLALSRISPMKFSRFKHLNAKHCTTKCSNSCNGYPGTLKQKILCNINFEYFKRKFKLQADWMCLGYNLRLNQVNAYSFTNTDRLRRFR